MGLKLPAAKTCTTWVTSIVLPAIHKTGGYVMGEEKVKTGELSMEEMTHFCSKNPSAQLEIYGRAIPPHHPLASLR